MAKIIFHIGSFKTGSTSIQMALSELENEYSKKFYYPRDKLLPDPTKSWIMMVPFLKSKWSKMEVLLQLKNGQQKAQKAGRVLISNIKKNLENGKNIIISSEEFIKLDKNTLQAFYSEFKDYCEKFEIVCYVRNYDTAVSSIVNQRTKNFFKFNDNNIPVPKYSILLSNFTDSSLFNNTIKSSAKVLQYFNNLICPMCNMSKHPFVTTVLYCINKNKN